MSLRPGLLLLVLSCTPSTANVPPAGSAASPSDLDRAIRQACEGCAGTGTAKVQVWRDQGGQLSLISYHHGGAGCPHSGHLYYNPDGSPFQPKGGSHLTTVTEADLAASHARMTEGLSLVETRSCK